MLTLPIYNYIDSIIILCFIYFKLQRLKLHCCKKYQLCSYQIQCCTIYHDDSNYYTYIIYLCGCHLCFLCLYSLIFFFNGSKINKIRQKHLCFDFYGNDPFSLSCNYKKEMHPYGYETNLLVRSHWQTATHRPWRLCARKSFVRKMDWN